MFVESQALTDALTTVETRLLDRGHFGAIQLRDVDVVITASENDEPQIIFEIKVSAPSGTQGAWSTEDVFALRSAVWQLLSEANITFFPVVALHPDSVDQEGDEEPDDLARALDADDAR